MTHALILPLFDIVEFPEGCASSRTGRRSAPLFCGLTETAELPRSADLWHTCFMCFRITATGGLVTLSSRTEHDEVMLHCARIGYKP